MTPLTVVKMGGNVLDDPTLLRQVLADIAAFAGPKLLVHGGGKMATRLAEQLNIPQTMLDGRRITDAATLDVAVMVYAGLINKQLVAGLQALGQNALGLSGADGNSLLATRRPPIPIDYGFVGNVKPDDVNTRLLSSLLEQKICPVFCAITHDGAGTLLNTNADTMASTLAIALSSLYSINLIYLFEKKGVMRDINDDQSLIESITLAEVEGLIETNVIQAGMIPKIRNAAAAVEQGVATVSIGQPAALGAMLAQKQNACTRIYG